MTLTLQVSVCLLNHRICYGYAVNIGVDPRSPRSKRRDAGHQTGPAIGKKKNAAFCRSVCGSVGVKKTHRWQFSGDASKRPSDSGSMRMTVDMGPGRSTLR
ncbi:hypothetical protein LY78DRAFT_658916, partial [Colletotrichum sublineola]